MGKWDDVCARCAKAGKKQVETVAHIQHVQCVSHVEAVMAALDRSWNEIMESIVKHAARRGAWSQSHTERTRRCRHCGGKRGLVQLSPPEHVEVEEAKERQAMPSESDGSGGGGKGGGSVLRWSWSHQRGVETFRL